MVIVHKKTKYGYRAIDTESNLFVCSTCGDLLNQECRAPYDSLCPCCRFNVNASAVVKQARHLSIRVIPSAPRSCPHGQAGASKS